MIYQFRSGNTYRGLDPQTVGDELERIRRANGGKLATTEVLRWAAEPDSPIHNAFTWDDERAAHAHRLDEARTLIKSIVVVAKTTDVPQPAFWNVSVSVPSAEPDETASEQYYQSAAVVAQSPAEFQSALSIMLRELSSAKRGLEQLYRLAPRGKKIGIKRATGQVESAQMELAEL